MNFPPARPSKRLDAYRMGEYAGVTLDTYRKM